MILYMIHTYIREVKVLTRSELACEPILVLLHVNLRRGTKANGSSKDKIICKIDKMINVKNV